MWNPDGTPDESVPEGITTWPFVPTKLALSASFDRFEQRSLADEDAGYPPSLCLEMGRRLLLAQLQSREWILRRVEKLDLSPEAAIQRRIALEFVVPRQAPTFMDQHDRKLRCVPISLMRRRTLLGLDLRDRDDRTVTMPGIRLQQQLDQAMLLAAAACRHNDRFFTEEGTLSAFGTATAAWANRAVCHPLKDVRKAYAELENPVPGSSLEVLNKDPLFMNVANRLKHNFTLYMFVPDDSEPSSSRLPHLLRMSFEEPVDWRYQRPELEPEDEDHQEGPWRYRPGKPRRARRAAMALFGWNSTRIRFQVPGAETAASYHFELTAPPGIQIIEATLIAGRPNDPLRHVSIDGLRGHSPTVGLHAVEVPSGSLCRVQTDLRATARGWLATMVVATAAITLLMATVFIHVLRHIGEKLILDDPEPTNAILLLVSAVAAVATLVVQREYSSIATRLVRGVRALVTASLAFPIIAAGILTYGGRDSSVMSPEVSTWVMGVLVFFSAVSFVIVGVAYTGSSSKERRALIQESPWNMTEFTDDGAAPPAPLLGIADFNEAITKARFHTPAIGVASAEGWHSVYDWDDHKHRDALRDLHARRWDIDSNGAAAVQRCSWVADSTCAKSALCPMRQAPAQPIV